MIPKAGNMLEAYRKQGMSADSGQQAPVSDSGKQILCSKIIESKTEIANSTQ
jgi:hypothetical protein